jgi:hypothetical protein
VTCLLNSTPVTSVMLDVLPGTVMASDPEKYEPDRGRMRN